MKTDADQAEDIDTCLGFVRRCRAHPIARRVKIADIRDNLDLTRLSTLTDRDTKRLAKYLVALRELETDA